MINQWKIPEKGGVGKSVPEKCKSPLTFTLKEESCWKWAIAKKGR